MGQIPYTLKFKIKKPNKLGEVLVYIRYYSSENDLLIPTPIRVPKDLFLPGKIKSPIKKTHPNHEVLNRQLDEIKLSIENRLALSKGPVSLDVLMGRTASSDLIFDFIDDFKDKMQGKMAVGRLRHYTVIQKKIAAFDRNVSFQSISLDWIQRFEKHIRKSLSSNTIHSNMTIFKAILNRAEELGKLDRKQYDKYVPPPYIEDLPVYLEESEIKAFYKIIEAAAPGPIKTSGYYFILGCYTGYRISDLMSFNYDERVKGKTIVLRAKKNKNIVSIPVFPMLKEILLFCKNNALNVTEKDMRLHVKSIAKLAGIKSDVKVHSARHSFAMLMLDKGLTIDEVAELLGDSKDVAKRYARITNKHLHKRVMDVMK